MQFEVWKDDWESKVYSYSAENGNLDIGFEAPGQAEK